MKPALVFLLALLLACPTSRGQELDPAFADRHGERMEALFAALDPLHPAMAPFYRDWELGRRREALRGLSLYFNRKTVSPVLRQTPTQPGNFLEQAEHSLENSYYILDHWETVPERPGGGLDWSYRGTKEDKEVAWMLNRHAILPILLQAYRKTGREEFRRQANLLLQDWIPANPYPDRMTFSAQWRPLEVARRSLDSWIAIFYAKDFLEPETRLLVLAALLDHADALRHHASFWGGNHLITEKLGLLSIALGFPEFRESAEWKAYADDRLGREFMEQTYPDGSYKELSNHYQLVVLRSAQRYVRLMAGSDTSFRRRPVYRRIEAMWDYFAGVMKPDGFGPLNNDSDLEPNDRYIATAWETFSRPDWLAMATNGEEGTLPTGPASRFYPWAGQVVVRNNWGSRGDWIFLDAGPYGSAHQHQDRLHLSACLRGRQVLADSGRYTYRPGPWRDYFSGPDSHSTLLLDGQPADQGPRTVDKPLPVEYADTPQCVFAAATARFPSPGSRLGIPSLLPSVPWTRALLYDKRNGFALILDHLVSFRPHQVRANWQFHPGIGEDEAGLYLYPANRKDDWESSLLTGRTEPPLGGFLSPEYNIRLPATRMVHHTRVDSPTTLAWILQDASDPPVEVEFLSSPGSPLARLLLRRQGRILAEAELRFYPHPELISYQSRAGL